MATILAVVPIDATEETFERDVIQRSFEHPVVVDFWAEWCGPCRSLGPVIEKAVEQRAGQVDLVKVDTDANPRLSQAFGIQSIPAVKAFKDGKVVDEFIGALPPVQVERFLDRIVPSEADALIAEGGDSNLRRVR
jgi:putative thioredoxin